MQKLVVKAKGLVLALLCVGCSASVAAESYISDAKSKWMFEQAASKLLSEGDLESPEKLLQGLQQESCQLDLPKPATAPLNSSELYEKCKLSTVAIATLYDCGRKNCETAHVNIASGFVIHEDGIVVTNHHVMTGLMRDDRTIHSSAVRDYEGNVYPVREILAGHEHDDLAILRVDTKGKKLVAAPLAESVGVGDDVHVISHPKGNFYMYSKGIVSRQSLQKSDPKSPERKRLNITADYAAGSSGGPVFDSQGNVVAIVASTLSLYYRQKEQKDLQMVVKSVIPVESLKALISS